MAPTQRVRVQGALTCLWLTCLFQPAGCAMAQRVVALVDLDCFYCAVERRRDPSLLGLPMAVVQYNPWDNARGGPCVVGGVTSRRPEEDRRDQLSTNQWRCKAVQSRVGPRRAAT